MKYEWRLGKWGWNFYTVIGNQPGYLEPAYLHTSLRFVTHLTRIMRAEGYHRNTAVRYW